MSIGRSGWAAPGTAERPDREGRQIRTKWEVLNGRRVRLRLLLPQADSWRDSGTHPPFLLLHGLGCAVETWEPTLLHLAERGLDRPVYAVDMPGFGRSQGPRRALSVVELAEWTVRLMDLIGISRAHLAGNSLGCQVALAISRQHPTRAASLILAGATTGCDLISLPSMALGLAQDGFREPGLYDGSLPWMYLHTSPRRFLETVRRMREDHPVRDAGSVPAPCLIVRGARDAAVPEWAARALVDALPHGVFRSIEGSPHAVQYAAPKAFADLMLDFCRRTEVKGGIRSAGAARTTDNSAVGAEPVALESELGPGPG